MIIEMNAVRQRIAVRDRSSAVVMILILVLLFLFCGDNNKGGLFGGLF